MDEITYRLQLARSQYNDSPVINQWHVLWSGVYHVDCYVDYLARVIRLGRRQDSTTILSGKHQIASWQEIIKNTIPMG